MNYSDIFKEIMNLKELIIPTANAQAVDALSQPTFGPIDVGGGGTSAGSVLLSADKTAVEVGDIVTVTLSINTNTTPISEYRITVDFDPTKFTVIDADAESSGTQVTLLDPVFVIEDPEEDNLVSSLGRIRVIAKSDDQLSLNRNVIEIKMQAQSAGATTLRVISEGTEPTQLIREAGVGLSYSNNEVGITIQTNTPEPEQPPKEEPGTQVPNPGVETPPVIPDTALEDFLPQYMPVIFGIFLLALGASLWKKREDEKEDR